MLREEAIKQIEALRTRMIVDDAEPYVVESLKMAVEALEQEPCDELDFVQPHKKMSVNLNIEEPCEDCVSRQAVLNYIRDNYRRWFINDDAFIQCVNGIKDIVPVTSQQKMGRWKPYDGSWYECSECGAVRKAVGFFENYCPNCGRKMEVDDE